MQTFLHEFQSALALVDVVLMQTQKFFHEYLRGDLTAKVLSLKVLYYSYTVSYNIKIVDWYYHLWYVANGTDVEVNYFTSFTYTC